MPTIKHWSIQSILTINVAYKLCFSVNTDRFLYLCIQESTKVIQPLLLGGLIRYFTPESQVTKTEGFMYAAGVSFCAFVLAIAHHPYFFGVQRIGMKMRVACCSLLYRKVRDVMFWPNAPAYTCKPAHTHDAKQTF